MHPSHVNTRILNSVEAIAKTINYISEFKEVNSFDELNEICRKISDACIDIISGAETISEGHINNLLAGIKIFANHFNKISSNKDLRVELLDVNDTILDHASNLESLLPLLTDENKQQNLLDQVQIYETLLNNLHLDLNTLTTRINNTESNLKTRLGPIEEAAKSAEAEISSLMSGIRSLATNASGELVYGNYKDSAASERHTSNQLRTISLFFMILAASIPLYSIIQSLSTELAITDIITRATLSLFLSIPAAYLARESAKHRRQQYLYQQYSLNLNALTPFIAELESPEKNAIKGELARTLFSSSHEAGSARDDTYPVNTHELLALLINKLDLKPSIDKSTRTN